MLVREHGYIVVPPYDDEQIIAGQATCGLEIVEDLPDVDLVLTPVSGGGLLSGVASAVETAEARRPGYSAWNRSWPPIPRRAFAPGKSSAWPAEMTSRTLADGLRTQSVGVRNFARHIQAFVDGIITVTEAEIRAAMRAIVAATRLVPEPSGAVAAAALRLSLCWSCRQHTARQWRWSAVATWTPFCWPRCSPKAANSVVRL